VGSQIPAPAIDTRQGGSSPRRETMRTRLQVAPAETLAGAVVSRERLGCMFRVQAGPTGWNLSSAVTHPFGVAGARQWQYYPSDKKPLTEGYLLAVRA